jgi:hypothetical protein
MVPSDCKQSVEVFSSDAMAALETRLGDELLQQLPLVYFVGVVSSAALAVIPAPIELKLWSKESLQLFMERS